MKKKILQLFVLVVVIFLYNSLSAQQKFQSSGVPACEDYFIYNQPDGSQIVMRLYGDAVVNWGETRDGYTVLLNKENYFCYAQKNDYAELVSTNIAAKNQQDRNTKDLQILTNTEKNLRYSEEQIIEKIAKHEFTSTRGRSKNAAFPTTGNLNYIILLVNYSDTETTHTQENFNNYMNETNYNGYGSFKDFYLQSSYGALTIETTVTPWIQLPNTREYYSDKYGELLMEALVQADVYLDFSKFDNDLDGYIDGIGIIHQGRGQEASGDQLDIWSHSWSLELALANAEEERTFDGVIANAYTIQPERLELQSYTGISTIGVMCHEFGHNLGAPDFYDTDYEACGSQPGNGKWDLMSSGSWNNTGQSPANHNIGMRDFYGWIEIQELIDQQYVTMTNSFENKVGYIIYTDATNEYFLLENRQPVTFDEYLPGHGLIIYHIDQDYVDIHSYTNDINTCEHQGFYIKSIDGYLSTTAAFPHNSVAINEHTTPNSLAWNGSFNDKTLSNIQETDGVISFYFKGDARDVQNFTSIPIGETEMQISWTSNTTNKVLLAYSKNVAELKMPENGTEYKVGDFLPDGAEVIYFGNDVTSITHTNLNSETQYFYKAWTLDQEYSAGTYTASTTLCGIKEVPYFQDLELSTDIPSCWTQEFVNGEKTWNIIQSNPYSGINCIKFYNQSSTAATTKLVMQGLNFQDNNNDYVISFMLRQPKLFTKNDILRVYYKNASDNEWTLLQEYTAYITSWTRKMIQLVDMSENYTIAFEGEATNGGGVFLDDIIIETGIDVKDIKNIVKVYPNPSQGIIYVEGNDIEKCEIIDVNGKILLSETENNTLNINSFADGVYFIKIYQANNILLEKIILNK